MKQNKTPMFVKLFVPEQQQINKKQLISLWGSPHSKEFHIVDNPSIVNRIANQIEHIRRPYSSVKNKTQGSESIKRQKPLYVVKKTKKNVQRLKFDKLGKQVNCLTDFIENQVSDLKQAEIFQYKQKMLVTFLQNFFHELESECHQKASFIKQIWNQMMSLFDRIFSIQNQNSLNYEKSSLKEILNLHKSYQEMFQKQKKSILTLQQESLKHKQLIKSLVINLRQRKKEIKVYQGGINDYNLRINNLNAQFDQLKKQHMEILMYGHQGNMTREEAQNMLMNILRPIDEDEQDLRNVISLKYIPPKMKKGKSQKYLVSSKDISNQLNDTNKVFQEDFCLQQDQIQQFLQVDNHKIKNNFIPKKVKIKNPIKKCDAKIQTIQESVKIQKEQTFVQCNYYEKINQFMIKNKYCQTQNKKPLLINAKNQTDFVEDQLFLQQKIAKLNFHQKVFDYNIENKFKKSPKFGKGKPSQKIIEFHPEFHPKSQDQKDFFQFEASNKNSARSRKISKSKINERPKSSRKNSLKNIKSSNKKSKIGFRNVTEQSESVIRTPLRTQNFVKLNRVRFSGQFKNMLLSYIESFNKSNAPQCSEFMWSVGLLKSYITNKIQMNPAESWGQKIFDLVKSIKQNPSNEQIILSFYYRNKKYKNINIVQQNFHYVSKVKFFVDSSQKNGLSKKKDKVLLNSSTGNFTIKKCYKIISSVFEIYKKIKNQKGFSNVNLVKILQKVLNPLSLNTKNSTREYQQHQSQQQFYKTYQFFCFLVRNIKENYLFKNFLFLCGINYKVQAIVKSQSGIFNINKNVSITQGKQNKKKSLHTDHSIKNSNHQKEQKTNERKLFGTMTYSSEVQFYFEMLQDLNCLKNDENNLFDQYTTLDVLQQNFDKLSKYYRDHQLLINIKGIIEDSLKHSMLNNSKLNLFKCLQIFLESIRQRKIQMFQSYQNFYHYLRNTQTEHLNKRFLLDILSVLKAPQQTQLKIISKCFKVFQNQMTFQDFITLFTIEGFPQFYKIEERVLKNKNQLNFFIQQIQEKSRNVVLEYIYQKIQQQKNQKIKKNLQNLNNSLTCQQMLSKQLNKIMSEKLLFFEISHIFLNQSKKQSQ